MNRVIYWIEKIKENKINNAVILIGNKINIIEREISKEEGEKLAFEFGLKYFECSKREKYKWIIFKCLIDKIIENQSFEIFNYETKNRKGKIISQLGSIYIEFGVIIKEKERKINWT